MEDLLWERYKDMMRGMITPHKHDLRRILLEVKSEPRPTLDIFPDLQLSVDDFLSKSVVVLGQTDCGKTNLVAVIIEELLGTEPYVSLSVIDKDGEYTTIKDLEGYEFVMTVGNTDDADYEIPKNPAEVQDFADELAEEVIKKKYAVIIDLSETSQTMRIFFLNFYLRSLYKFANTEYNRRHKSVHVVLLDEAQNWMPLKVNEPDKDLRELKFELKDICEKIAKEGRKRGLSAIIASQRNQSIDRNITSQAQTKILMRIGTEPTDIKLYKDMYGFNIRWIQDHATSLKAGEVLFISPKYQIPKPIYEGDEHVGDEEPLRCRLRYSAHPSETPDWEDVVKMGKRAKIKIDEDEKKEVMEHGNNNSLPSKQSRGERLDTESPSDEVEG